MNQWTLVAVVVAATSAGQVLQAIGMRRHGEVRNFAPGALGSALTRLFQNAFVIASVACMAVSFFAFLNLLSIADLSFAVPATAASYVVQTVLAKYLLKERVSPSRWAGASLVALGVAILSL
jgi:drug/metabolite transporter (DMT)-like permease